MHTIYNTAVSKDWIDYNGHMNAGYYNVVIDKAAEDLIAKLGGLEYMERTSGTFYSVETHIMYLAELKVGDPIRVETQIVGCDRKRLHVFSTLYHADKNYAAASVETMMLHYNQNEQAVVPMQDDFYAPIRKLADEQAALPQPDAVGRSIRTVKR